MPLRAAPLFAKRLLGAIILGVATLLLLKPEPDQHWSEPPIIQLIADHDQAAVPGDPPGDDGDKGDRPPS